MMYLHFLIMINITVPESIISPLCQSAILKNLHYLSIGGTKGLITHAIIFNNFQEIFGLTLNDFFIQDNFRRRIGPSAKLSNSGWQTLCLLPFFFSPRIRLYIGSVCCFKPSPDAITRVAAIASAFCLVHQNQELFFLMVNF